MNLQIISEEKLNEIILKIDTIQKMLSEMENGKTIQKEWLTVKEASDFLSVTTRSMQNYRDKGLIPFTDFGGKILFHQKELQDFLMKNRVDYYSFKNQSKGRF